METLYRRMLVPPHKKLGRKPLARHIIALVKRMKSDNPFWGARRISNELKKLSVGVSHTTVNKLIASFYRNGTLYTTTRVN